MAARKTTKSTRTARKTSRATKSTAPKQSIVKNEERQSSGLLESFKFGESYTSLILGIVVVIIVLILLIAFVRGRSADKGNEQATSSTQTEESVKTYVVQSGDDLWSIAENEYGSGYEWVTIAEENKLADPSLLEEGTELILPPVEDSSAATLTPTPTTAQPLVGQRISGNTYSVQEGDYLWDIAIRAYNDGYRWVDIARENNIVNPDIIYPGTELTLPRS